MHNESPALRAEVLVTLSLALGARADRLAEDVLRRLGRANSDDLAADAIRSAMEKPSRSTGLLEIPRDDAEASEAIAALPTHQRLALILRHGRHWDDARISRALGVDDGAEAVRQAEIAVAETVRPRLAWEIDHQLHNLHLEPSSDRKRRLMTGLAVLVVAVASLLTFLAITQANIKRPDLIQLRPSGLLRANADGDITRLIEEEVTVARVTADNEILYQFSGGPGVAGGSVWYSPGPGQRAGQLIPKTGGVLGWVEPENLPSSTGGSQRQAIALVADRPAGTGSGTTTHAIVLVDPTTGTTTKVVELGTSTGSEESSTAGTKPVFASYGGDRVLVWMMDAVALESLPSGEVTDCGEWQMFSLAGEALPPQGPAPVCNQNGVSLSVPTLDPTGTRLLWLETTGSIDSANAPREGWLSSQTTVLKVIDFDSDRSFSIELSTINQPTFWAQYTMFSQQTGTVSIDSEGDIAVVSVGIWNPDVAVQNYTTYLVDLVGERVEVSASDGRVTFGH